MARPNKKQTRIKQAQELLDNPVLSELFDERKESLRDKWQASTTLEDRERCHSEINALEDLKAYVYATANTRND